MGSTKYVSIRKVDTNLPQSVTNLFIILKFLYFTLCTSLVKTGQLFPCFGFCVECYDGFGVGWVGAPGEGLEVVGG